jgi:hypothetical protein
MRTLIVALLLVLLAPPLAAQIRYKDDEGVTNWVDSIDEVPEKYRAGAVGTPTKGLPSGVDSEKKVREGDDQEKRAAEETKQPRYSVTYAVEGEVPSASVTYRDEQGESQQETAKVPWKRAFHMQKGALLSISAENQYRQGSITVRILVDGKVFKRSDSEGASASVSGTCC